jgi:hypothetical protein
VGIAKLNPDATRYADAWLFTMPTAAAYWLSNLNTFVGLDQALLPTAELFTAAVGLFGPDGVPALIPIVVETVLEIWGEWAPSALVAVTEDVSVPLVLPDTA